jgi:hypothetical protein
MRSEIKYQFDLLTTHTKPQLLGSLKPSNHVGSKLLLLGKSLPYKYSITKETATKTLAQRDIY